MWLFFVAQVDVINLQNTEKIVIFFPKPKGIWFVCPRQSSVLHCKTHDMKERGKQHCRNATKFWRFKIKFAVSRYYHYMQSIQLIWKSEFSFISQIMYLLLLNKYITVLWCQHHHTSSQTLNINYKYNTINWIRFYEYV